MIEFEETPNRLIIDMTYENDTEKIVKARHKFAQLKEELED